MADRNWTWLVFGLRLFDLGPLNSLCRALSQTAHPWHLNAAARPVVAPVAIGQAVRWS